MSNRDRLPQTETVDGIVPGQFVDVHVWAGEAFSAILARAATEPCTLIDAGGDDGKSPELFEQVVLESSGPHPYFPEIPNLHALVSFDPMLLPAEHEASWSTQILGAIEAALEKSSLGVHPMPHEINARYVRIDQHFLARIAASSEYDSCKFDITLVTVDEYESAHADILSPGDPAEQADAEQVTKSVASLLALTAEQVLEVVGTGQKRDQRYLLEFDEQLTIPTSQEMGSRAVALFEGHKIFDGEPLHDDIDDELITFSDLGGMTAAKRELGIIKACMEDIEGTRRYGVSPTHFILSGPTGTGKTSLVRALANETNAELICIGSEDVIDKFNGGSAKNLQRLFDEIFESKDPTIVFFDEIDTIASTDNHARTTKAHEEVKKLLKKIIITATEHHPNIIIAAATNVGLDNIEPELVGSGKLKPIDVSFPNIEELREIWAIRLMRSQQKITSSAAWDEVQSGKPTQAFELFSVDLDCTELAEHSSGLTGAVIGEIIAEAQYNAYVTYKQTGQDCAVSHQAIMALVGKYKK